MCPSFSIPFRYFVPFRWLSRLILSGDSERLTSRKAQAALFRASYSKQATTNMGDKTWTQRAPGFPQSSIMPTRSDNLLQLSYIGIIPAYQVTWKPTCERKLRSQFIIGVTFLGAEDAMSGQTGVSTPMYIDREIIHSYSSWGPEGPMLRPTF